MLLQQLTRVKEIDTQISDLHARLTNLYDERAGLLSFSSLTPELLEVAATSAAAPTPLTPKSLYASLKSNWRMHTIALPAQKTLQTKLQKAILIMDELVADNSQLAGQLTVVVVPPFKLLERPALALETLRIVEPNLLASTKKSQIWSLLVVVQNPDFSTEITNLQSFIGNADYMYKNYDCRGLGVQELLAAELQGVHVTEQGSWTLLLKGVQDDSTVPCATSLDEKVLLDIDDTNGLLGQNYLCPAIVVR
jgi:hypothetical protein